MGRKKQSNHCFTCGGSGFIRTQDFSAWGTYKEKTVPCTACGGRAGGRCFVATAAYGDYDAPEVRVLRQFRDDRLSKSFWGNAFISTYYKISPPLASVIEKSDFLRNIVRNFFLKPLISVLGRKNPN